MLTGSRRFNSSASATIGQGPVVGSTTILMHRGKECKGSVRYEVPKADADTAAVTNVYLARSFNGGNLPNSIRVTVQAA